MPATKTCTKCGETKAVDLFSNHRKHKDGKNPWCKACCKEYLVQWTARNLERKRATNQAYTEATREQKREYDRARYPAIAERAKAKSHAWYAANRERALAASKARDPAKKRERDREYARENLPAFLARNAERRATKGRATPPWVESDKVRKVYEGANRLGGHVDHIVPLKSRLVSGLHCWANLQVLPPETNLAKGNRAWPDMP